MVKGSSTRRVGGQVVASGKREGRDDPISQVKTRLEEVLAASQARLYRSVVLSAAYLSQDRPDFSLSAKGLVKRLGRYWKKRPRFVQLFVEHAPTGSVVQLDVDGDSDDAGCLKTRKSTTGMVSMHNAHGLKVSSHTQSTISFSSGESEYYGIAKCAAFGLGARSMFADGGTCADVVVRTDSSSGLAVDSEDCVAYGTCRHDTFRYRSECKRETCA